jgi:hypothetical protein
MGSFSMMPPTMSKSDVVNKFAAIALFNVICVLRE